MENTAPATSVHPLSARREELVAAYREVQAEAQDIRNTALRIEGAIQELDRMILEDEERAAAVAREAAEAKAAEALRKRRARAARKNGDPRRPGRPRKVEVPDQVSEGLGTPRITFADDEAPSRTSQMAEAFGSS